MREPYIEGLAIHDAPESCAAAREGRGEALTGARAGRAIEPRNHESRVPTLLSNAEGHTSEGAMPAPLDPAGSENLSMRGISMRENREIWACPPEMVRGDASARPEAVLR